MFDHILPTQQALFIPAKINGNFLLVGGSSDFFHPVLFGFGNWKSGKQNDTLKDVQLVFNFAALQNFRLELFVTNSSNNVLLVHDNSIVNWYMFIPSIQKLIGPIFQESKREEVSPQPTSSFTKTNEAFFSIKLLESHSSTFKLQKILRDHDVALVFAIRTLTG